MQKRFYNLRAIKISPAGGSYFVNDDLTTMPNTGDTISVADLFKLVKQYDPNFHPKSEASQSSPKYDIEAIADNIPMRHNDGSVRSYREYAADKTAPAGTTIAPNFTGTVAVEANVHPRIRNVMDTIYNKTGIKVGFAERYLDSRKDDATEDASQFLRSLNIDEAGNVIYTLIQGQSTYGACCASSFKNVAGLPFYLGKDGVYTIAGTTVQNQNNTTLRSLQINNRFLQEDLTNAVRCRHRRWNTTHSKIISRLFSYICQCRIDLFMYWGILLKKDKQFKKILDFFSEI